MTKETVKNKGGRPSKYKEEYTELAFKYCLLGATDERLAEFFDVSVASIDNWKVKHPEFLGALKAGKHEADATIAQSLYHRAKGYSHKETKVFNNQGEILTHEVDKHYPPDTAAAFIWLKNRGGWKDKQEVEHSGEVVTFNMNFGGAKDADD